MSTWNRQRILFALLLLQLVGLCYFASYYRDWAYLPSPFLSDKGDTFMDLFNPMFFADVPGRYTEWKSVYPPLIFVVLRLLKLLTIPEWKDLTPFGLRIAGAGAIYLHLLGSFAMVAAVLCTPAWRGFSRLQKTLVFAIFAASAPFLFAVERGNLVVYAMFFLALALGSRRATQFAAVAMLVNLKPYFVLLMGVYLLKGRMRDFFLAVLATGCLYVLTGLLLGDPNFVLSVPNLFVYAQSGTLFTFAEVTSLPSSLSAFSYGVNAWDFRHMGFLPLVPYVNEMQLALETVKWTAVIVALWALSSRRREISAVEMICVLMVVITNMGVSAGGYSLIFYFPLVPVFMAMRYGKAYLVLIALMFAPLDLVHVLRAPALPYQPTLVFLSDRVASVEWFLTLGSALRPFFNIALLGLVGHELMARRVARGQATVIAAAGPHAVQPLAARVGVDMEPGVNANTLPSRL
jgi:hypothetical protein